jgi:hypothetical protein
MFATNLILLLALVAMFVGAIWLFRDGEGVGPKPAFRVRRDAADDRSEKQIRVSDPEGKDPDTSR